ncbi:hypothetical protein J7E88_32485 [Streptomyces sp. ISL-10]|uniref:hypothetical protein n=1 Tax=Streptomyces sp. ISL-10 TaxID=2819172 RepID=UPI001BE8DF68|nr:hypothetical protein [Streptomyces sp. ISL-10]MBT2369864.1 hypothetical protein [Streptomyces sp. ISL-10]
MTPDDLYALLPAVHRRLDAENGHRLYALLSVIAEQARTVQEDMEQLYDNWFIETCEDWVVPYIGDLVGHRLLPGTAAALADGAGSPNGATAVTVPRRDVADTIAHRRRKGTLALLEDLAAGVAGWPARAVEYRRLLAVTQPVRRYGADPHDARRRLLRGGLVDVRHVDVLDRVGGPFDELARTVEVPRTGSARRPGRYGIPGVGLHVWRLRTHSVTQAPALCVDRARARYTFSVLGNDTPLFTAPVPEPSPCHVADEMNVPAPLRRRALAERLYDYYGPSKSVCVWTGGQVVAPNRIVSADLSGWHYRPRSGQVALDPVLGRIAFPPGEAPAGGHDIRVTYHHAVPGDLGGGEYPRAGAAAVTTAPNRYKVGPDREYGRISDAIDQWRSDKRWHPEKAEAVVEITGNDLYQDLTEIRLDLGDRLTIRAVDGVRPVIRLPLPSGDRPRALQITGTDADAGTDAASGTGEAAGTDSDIHDVHDIHVAAGRKQPPHLVLDGLVITGGSVQVRGSVGRLTIRHCTFVPGWELGPRSEPRHPDAAGLEIFDSPVRVDVEHSVIGTVGIARADEAPEPNVVALSDSVLDATSRDAAALTGSHGEPAHAVLTAHRTTVIGVVRARAVDLLEDCLLHGEAQITRRAQGSVRFCWLPTGSRTPPRFHCEPEHSGDAERVALRFAGTRYGTSDYVRLADGCAEEITRGAHDGAEPGALHDLFQLLREDNLRVRLAEFTPAGCDAGLFFAT